MTNIGLDKDAVIKVMNKTPEAELAGVVYYTHGTLMVFGYSSDQR